MRLGLTGVAIELAQAEPASLNAFSDGGGECDSLAFLGYAHDLSALGRYVACRCRCLEDGVQSIGEVVLAC